MGEAKRKMEKLTPAEKAERWDGRLPTTVLPDGAVPFIDAASGN